MAQTPKKGTEYTHPEIAKKTLEKKAYASPQLLEYGSITKLTQSGTGPVNDIGGMMRA